MELELKPGFYNGFHEQDLDENVSEWMKSAFFDLLLWEDLELHGSDYVFSAFALVFRSKGLVFLLSKSK